MFIDRTEIFVRSGKGGNGCVSFRREKYVPKGGPDGGDGGDGGHVFIVADPSVNTLLELAGKHHWTAENGRPGHGKNMTGRNGRDRVVRVPPGTLIYDRDTGRLLKDLNQPEQKVRIATGGKGGKGNRRFATATEQTPRHAEEGGEPEERWLRLELKLIADVGLVGQPNAGKSTLLSRLTKARPKIADYPFTTLEPQLGIVEMPDYRRFVMADIPGLIEGAHEGVGLGDDFLRHIERTRVLLHMLDVHPLEGRKPIEAYHVIRNELYKYSPKLAEKQELVVANKIDLSDNLEAVDELRDELNCEVVAISAVTGAGLEKLSKKLWAMIQDAKEGETYEAASSSIMEDPFSGILDNVSQTDQSDNTNEDQSPDETSGDES
jgi:GTP-binding protein